MRFPEALQAAHEALRRGDDETALANARQATALLNSPNAPPPQKAAEAWWLLGTAADRLEDIISAEMAYAEAARWAPEGSPVRAQMLVLRGKPLMADGRVIEAVEATRAAVRLGLEDVPSLVRASYTFTHAGLPNEALTLVLKATARNPHHAEAWYSLGSVHRALGDINASEAAFKQAIALSPTPPVAAYFNLAYLRRWTPDDNHVSILENLTCQTRLEACRVAYTLFKEYDDMGDRANAWDCLQVGAGLARKEEPWSSDEEAATVAAWKQYFPATRFEAIDERPRSGPKRIFIVGLPRSGTTLIERVLAAHSQVQAVGELKTFGIATHKLSGVSDTRRLSPEVIEAAAKIDPLAIAELYQRESAFLHDGRPYVIDKLPANHEYIGLIKLAFPDATIVTLDRNPMDALFGSYKVLFTGAYGWSYTQDDLADHYGHFRDLMAYWKSVLGDSLVEVSLEAVIQDPETEIRRLIDACGLPFEDACLKPHEAKGAVSTASAVQVRAPINSKGVGAWKKYEAELEPLKQRLEKMGFLSPSNG
ncbi:MAG: sulfotransferase [Asticcacaulis sp.]|uniref:tetratricopeptide repeat-containing sulfotransferase family protein n=1 Tax=Asticcacaulis sp. TaxID=1872648 RepID=UPI0039E3C2D3